MLGLPSNLAFTLERTRYSYDPSMLPGETVKTFLNLDPIPSECDVSSEGYGHLGSLRWNTWLPCTLVSKHLLFKKILLKERVRLDRVACITSFTTSMQHQSNSEIIILSYHPPRVELIREGNLIAFMRVSFTMRDVARLYCKHPFRDVWVEIDLPGYYFLCSLRDNLYYFSFKRKYWDRRSPCLIIFLYSSRRPFHSW